MDPDAENQKISEADAKDLIVYNDKMYEEIFDAFGMLAPAIYILDTRREYIDDTTQKEAVEKLAEVSTQIKDGCASFDFIDEIQKEISPPKCDFTGSFGHSVEYFFSYGYYTMREINEIFTTDALSLLGCTIIKMIFAPFAYIKEKMALKIETALKTFISEATFENLYGLHKMIFLQDYLPAESNQSKWVQSSLFKYIEYQRERFAFYTALHLLVAEFDNAFPSFYSGDVSPFRIDFFRHQMTALVQKYNNVITKSSLEHQFAQLSVGEQHTNLVDREIQKLPLSSFDIMYIMIAKRLNQSNVFFYENAAVKLHDCSSLSKEETKCVRSFVKNYANTEHYRHFMLGLAANREFLETAVKKWKKDNPQHAEFDVVCTKWYFLFSK